MNATELKRIIVSAGYEARSYSGRGMYGKECVGVTCDNQADLLFDMMDHASRTQIKQLKGCMTDSMGRSIIVYWPNIEWSEDEEE
jgi:hypothetical protein